MYAPTKYVSIIFALLFTISGVLHIWQNNLKFKSWRIGALLPWAAALFVSGFVLREYAAHGHYNNQSVFISSTVLLFCGPPVYAGASYFIFGRVLYYIPYLSPLHPGRVWSTFIGLDTVVETLAGNGAAQVANRSNSPAKIKLGLTLIKASLLLQLGLFVAFVFLVVVFHIRCLRAGVFSRNVKIVIYELYACSVLILLRNSYRTAAFFYPYVSTPNDTEWLWWVLDALPMVTCTWILNIWPPAKYFPSNYKIYLAKDGKTELEGPGAADRRHFLLTVFDPCDVIGLITKSDRKNRFWEEDGIGGPAKIVPVDENGHVTEFRNNIDPKV